MGPFARVESLESLIELKAALCVFTAEAKEALSSVEMEIQRSVAWLDEQLKQWQAEVRRGEDAVFQAKNELVRRKMMRIGDRPPDCSEQEEALERARVRLEHAEEQVEKTRRWQRELPEAVITYEGPARQLGGVLEADMPRADAFLENKIASLEAYVQLTGSGPAAAPSAAMPQAESSSPGDSAPKGETP
jgi:hypothetical protein